MVRTPTSSVWHAQTPFYHSANLGIPRHRLSLLPWKRRKRLHYRDSFIEKEGVWHPIAISSHSMTPQEQNYPITDKEMLSVIQALEQWRHYLEGARHQFEIWNDHANLQWFMQRQDLNQQQVCWAQYLSRLNVVWCYKPRSSMGKSNALSRWEDHTEGIEDDNKGVISNDLCKIQVSLLCPGYKPSNNQNHSNIPH